MTLLEFEVPFLEEIRLRWHTERFNYILMDCFTPVLDREFKRREALFEMLEQPDVS